jgi:catechol 2,3-dioxygenase-like lactoylglutathione lyase family enzyme
MVGNRPDRRYTEHLYTQVLGFGVRYARHEERFAYLDLAGAALMIEQTVAGARTLVAGTLDYPFGRGINLQISIDDVDSLYTRARAAGNRIFLPLEERWYRRDAEEVGNRQFVVMDPDGYLLRFAQDLGARSINAMSTPTN